MADVRDEGRDAVPVDGASAGAASGEVQRAGDTASVGSTPPGPAHDGPAPAGAPGVAPAGLRQPLQHPPPRPGLGALVAVLLALAAAVGLYTAFTGVGPALVDAALLSESLEVRSSALTTLAVLVTDIGSTVSMAVLATAVGVWCWYVGRRADALLAIGAMAGAAGVFRVLKALFDRPRPPAEDQLVSAANESLPSGHATMSIVVIGTLVVLAWSGRSAAARAALVAVATLWVGAIGATRIYLGVHWFSDVLAGWLVGAAWLALCVVLWSSWRAHHQPTTRLTGTDPVGSAGRDPGASDVA
ncbi:phosphatase PAP2 family protein [Pseudonocardia sp.]|uniref:phosphatase PAP2 family protein n=1 Tax=Pseudonocardia sp. TaxID=60912 RepID=UPI0031FD8333